MEARGVRQPTWSRFRSLVLALLILVSPDAVAIQPSGGEALATYKEFTASVPQAAGRSSLNVLRVDSESRDAFLDDESLQTLVRAALQSAATKRYVRVADVRIEGYHGETQVYWGAASSQTNWNLETRFSLPQAIEKVDFSPSGVSGLLTLAHQVKSQRQATSGRLPLYEQAVSTRAEQLLDRARSDFGSQLESIDEAGGLAAVRAMQGRVLEALDTVGLARHAADFAAMADAEVLRRENALLSGAAAALREANADDLFAVLNLGVSVEDLHQSLVEHGTVRAAEALEQLVHDQVEARLGQESTWTAFHAELRVFSDDARSLPELLVVGEDLQVLEETQPALIPYVDAVAIRMEEVLLTSFDADVAGIADAGQSVFDTPALALEVLELAEWYLEWGAEDLAEGILDAGEGRIAVLSEQSYERFKSEVERRDVLQTTTRQLRDELQFFYEHAEIVPNADAYVELVSSTLNRLQAQLSADLLERLGLPQGTKGIGISVAGHQLDIGTFAENLSNAGHRLIAATADARGDEGHYLSSITIATDDGVEVTIGGGPEHEGDPHFTGSFLQVQDESEDLYPNEWLALMLQLGAVVPTGNIDPSGVADSDRFASDPFDPQKVVEQGVFAEELVYDVALEASLLAIEENPDEPRFYFHAGRTLWAMGEKEEATLFFERAHTDGYPAASYALGSLLLESVMSLGDNEMPKVTDLRRAKQYFQVAADSGYAIAEPQVEMVAQLMAGMSPDFSQGFQMPALVRAIYTGNVDNLVAAPERERTNHIYYFFNLRGVVAEQHEGFRNSVLLSEIDSFAPETIKNAWALEDRIVEQVDDPRNPANMLMMLQEYMTGMEQMMADPDFWSDVLTVDSRFPEAAGCDGAILMMYIGHDDEEIVRVFGNLLAYLRRVNGWDAHAAQDAANNSLRSPEKQLTSNQQILRDQLVSATRRYMDSVDRIGIPAAAADRVAIAIAEGVAESKVIQAELGDRLLEETESGTIFKVPRLLSLAEGEINSQASKVAARRLVDSVTYAHPLVVHGYGGLFQWRPEELEFPAGYVERLEGQLPSGAGALFREHLVEAGRAVWDCTWSLEGDDATQVRAALSEYRDALKTARVIKASYVPASGNRGVVSVRYFWYGNVPDWFWEFRDRIPSADSVFEYWGQQPLQSAPLRLNDADAEIMRPR